ncbi:MAG: Coenzyme F420 hydrogenase/dehydrogenase, beta subunit C-terminal domain [Methanophagales archaeon]|nr:Coenzyme F420 hydrogenase/dehydrogenase, beta subunit C-terminal domain [Methanophagales archaeon]
MNNNTIAQVVRDGLCTGCGTCIALCPEEAIKLTINEKKGIYVPELNEEKCNNCGICYEVCPGHEVDFKALHLEIFGKEPEKVLIGNYLNCYVGHSTDYDLRYGSSSGGIVTALLIFLLEEGIINGALVTKMKKDKPLKPEPFIARTREEIIEASKSKYCPVPANIALREILESKEGEKFAVVGLPCHILGIRKAEQINEKLQEKIALHLGLFCCSYGVNFLATEYVLQRINIPKENIIRIDYREGNFPPGIMSIRLEKGDIKKISHSEFWGTIFYPFVSWFGPVRCMLCGDQTCELADISVGSEWFPYLECDNVNQSLVLVRTKIGEKILQKGEHKSKLKLIKIDKEIRRDYKQNRLKAHMSLFKLLGKKTPNYNLNGLPNPTFKIYLSSASLYMRAYFSSKRCLWGLMLSCQSFLRKILSVIPRK